MLLKNNYIQDIITFCFLLSASNFKRITIRTEKNLQHQRGKEGFFKHQILSKTEKIFKLIYLCCVLLPGTLETADYATTGLLS